MGGGAEYIDPHFLHLSSFWKSVVSFTLLALNPLEMFSWHPLDCRLGGLHWQPGSYGEVKIRDPTGTRTATPQSVTSSRFVRCQLI
jgi:hypothetical protein